ncbi:response regulator transcription factor [Oceanobacillus sp. FSL H7-0719]|uniref:response regulator transcription factor n=1 Tax=Oceanobacillus sp. FSL H7-0719 TaxID=2954507 RepID=UPI0032487EE0
MSMITILIVDDDPNIRELLRFYIQREGYKAIEAADGAEALTQLDSIQIQLAIVDIMMPNIDGYQLCEEIRQTYDIPVLMVTAKGEIQDKEKAYAAGTDDYIVKPFEPKEILFRIKALLRRFQISNQALISAGNAVINRKNYEIESLGKTYILPLKEFELLAQLASYPNQTFSREQLIATIWGNDFDGSDRTVDVHIKRLRERFPEQVHGFSIQTIRGLGYKLTTK